MHHICPTEDYTHSSITVDGKDIGITYIEYGDIVEEEPSEHCIKVPFDFGKGPVTGCYKTYITAKGATIPDGCDVVVEYGVTGYDKPLRDTLRNVRKVDEDKYVCDWINWNGIEPIFGMHDQAANSETTLSLRRHFIKNFRATLQTAITQLDEAKSWEGVLHALTCLRRCLAVKHEHLPEVNQT